MSEFSSDGTTDWKFEVFSHGDCLGSVVELKIGTNKGIKLGFYNQKLVGTTHGAVVGFSLETYVGSELGSLE